ncbi:amino acid adenylation domain-containing protein, partial [Pseudomonas sp. dw_612]|uniref:non-ribosomal peptide synthetase n=1 Tax=Pseudomonas sp. dw_612 TaxID=2720080 RepID=UPI001BD5C2B3
AVERVPLLSAQERRLQVQDWNQTQADFPRHSCLHSLFEAQVRQAPERLAVLHDQQRLSYGELNTRANRLAHELRRHGVRPGDLVAICAHRSPDMLVALLAVLKAGAAYVPMDPAYPAQRLAFMLDDCAPALVLTHAAARGALEAALEQAVPIALLDLDRDAVQWADSPDGDAPLAELTARHLAYVIYTSGSTGQPKGVMVEHCSVVNQVSFMARECALGEGDRFLQFASFAFDVAVEEVFATLLSGAALVLRDDQWLRSPKDFLAHCSAQAVTVMDLPTAFWQSVTVDRHLSIPPTLRQIIIGGEALSEDALARWFEREGHRPALVNAYGPTEATVNATLAHLNGPCDWSHIGRPTANTHLYVLDDQGEPVPLGVAGELWIGGAGVARGYLNRDDLNTRHFHTSRFVDGDRLYRTGDRVRYLSDGTLQFQGRSDFQVKLRGFRIELGEIEAALREHPQVREAAVLAREEQAGEKRLVAYVVPTQSTQPESAQSLRTHLQARLPDYMVPAAYVTLASLPLTTNGKLDRQALPVPQEDAYARHGYEAPQGEVEVALAALWQEVLGVE